MTTPRLRQIPPIYTEKSYSTFRLKEMPDAIDRARAIALLEIDSEKNALKNYKEIMEMFAKGEARHGLQPRNCINVMAMRLKVKWNGVRYVG